MRAAYDPDYIGYSIAAALRPASAPEPFAIEDTMQRGAPTPHTNSSTKTTVFEALDLGERGNRPMSMTPNLHAGSRTITRPFTDPWTTLKFGV